MSETLACALEAYPNNQEVKELVKDQLYYKTPVSVANWVNGLHSISLAARMVLRCLVDDSMLRNYRGSTHLYAKMAVNKIAEVLGITRATVMKHLKTLTEHGVIKRVSYKTSKLNNDVSTTFVLIPEEILKSGPKVKITSLEKFKSRQGKASPKTTPESSPQTKGLPPVSLIPANLSSERLEMFDMQVSDKELYNVGAAVKRCLSMTNSAVQHLVSQIVFSHVLGSYSHRPISEVARMAITLVKKGRWNEPIGFTEDWYCLCEEDYGINAQSAVVEHDPDTVEERVSTGLLPSKLFDTQLLRV